MMRERYCVYKAVMSAGHESCVELLLEHSQKHEFVGNAFSPLHCAVLVVIVMLSVYVMK